MRKTSDKTGRLLAALGFAILLAVQAPFAVSAQERLVRFERISVEHGLSQSTVNAILQDNLGFMWFGTDDGLNKYDGIGFEVYRHNPEDQYSLSHNTVTVIYQGPSGQLWVGTKRGLNLVNRSSGQFSLFDPKPDGTTSLAREGITALLQDSHGILWIGTENGLRRWDPVQEALTHFTYSNSDPGSLWNNSVVTLYEDRSQNLWVGTSNGGLDRFNPHSSVFEHFGHNPDNPDSPEVYGIRSILEDTSGSLWLATCGSGLYRFTPGSGRYEHFRYEEGNTRSINHACVRNLLNGVDGEIWAATGNGLAILDPVSKLITGRYYHDPNDLTSLTSNQLVSLYRDRSGITWVGTIGGGLSKHSPFAEKFDLIRHRPNDPTSLLGSIVMAIYEDDAGGLWVGTLDGGLNYRDPSTGKFTHFLNNPQNNTTLAQNQVKAVVEDHRGKIWVATGDRGLDRLDPNTRRFTHFRHNPLNPESLSSDQVTTLLVDRAGRVWVGSLGGGLDRYDPGTSTFEHYPLESIPSNRLSDANVRAIYEDRTGRLWLAVDNGFTIYNPAEDTVTRFSPDLADPLGLQFGAVLSFYEDSNGTMWIGSTNGLHQYDPTLNQYIHFNQKNGLPNEVVNCILSDSHGSLWLSTNRGISRFDPKNLTFRSYDITDGLQNNEFNSGACFQGRDETLFFGGIDGLSSFSPSKILDNPQPPPVVITSFKKFNQTIHTDLAGTDDPITLSYRDNYISFEFAALDYTAPQKNQYAYKLEGFDADWVYTGSRRFASYTNLKGGEYTFRVKAANNDGIWNEEGISLQIIVQPPFWENWWFLASVFAAAAAGVFGLYRARVHQIESQNRRLAAQVEQRTGELRQEIEQRRQTETALRFSESQYRDLVENANSMIVRWDTQGRILFFNRYAQEFFGYQEEEIIGQNVLGTILPERDQAGRLMEEWLGDLFQRPSLYYTTENENTLRDGRKVWIAWTNKAVFDSQGKLVEILSIGLDRTSQKLAEEELSRQAEQAAIAAERSRLARDLHDAVSQTLFSTSLIAEVMPRLWERDPQEGYRRLDEIRQLTRGALAEMRTLLMELRPTALLDAEIGELFRHLADAFSGRTRIPVEMSIEDWGGVGPILPPDVKLSFYRIAQEAFNNVAKHAGATSVRFAFQHQDGEIILAVQDNGRGFTLDNVKPDHLGIAIMRERAESITARFELVTRPGEGTLVITRWCPPPGNHDES